MGSHGESFHWLLDENPLVRRCENSFYQRCDVGGFGLEGLSFYPLVSSRHGKLNNLPTKWRFTSTGKIIELNGWFWLLKHNFYWYIVSSQTENGKCPKWWENRNCPGYNLCPECHAEKAVWALTFWFFQEQHPGKISLKRWGATSHLLVTLNTV